MRSHAFDYALREEAAPALGSMPESPSDPNAPMGGENKKNDLTARNTLLGVSDEEADKDRESKVFDLHQALVRHGTKEPIFDAHGMLSWDTLPVTAERLGDDQWNVTFHYTLANQEMITDNKNMKIDPKIIEDKEETLNDEMMDWIEGHGYMGGSPDIGMKPDAAAGAAAPPPMGDPMGAAPGMPGAAPMPGGGMMGTGPNMGM